MMRVGYGKVNVFTRSVLPSCANRSISSLPMRPTISSSQRASAFWVNALVTRDRSLPCTGSSMPEHHPVAQHVTEDLDHGVRRVGLVVAQHRLDVLVPVHDEDGLALLARHRGHVDALDRRLVALFGQLGVRVADVARDDVVERPEVLEVVEQI